MFIVACDLIDMFSCLVSVEEVRTNLELAGSTTRHDSGRRITRTIYILCMNRRIFVADKTFDRCNIDVKMQNVRMEISKENNINCANAARVYERYNRKSD